MAGGMKRRGAVAKKGRGEGRRGDNRIREREGLPPLEWRSGYAPECKHSNSNVLGSGNFTK